MASQPLPDTFGVAPIARPRASLDAVRSLRPLIESRVDEMERDGRLHPDVVRGMLDAGVFAMLVPESLGGGECDPLTVSDVLSELSYMYPSAGWVAMATSVAAALAGAYLGDAAAEEIFAPGDRYICAGTAQPRGRAERAEDGYRLKGNFAFGSGSAQASWLLGGYLLSDDAAPNGRRHVIAHVRREQVDLKGNWDVMGLGATQSYDYEVREHVVPEAFVVEWGDAQPVRGGDIYKMGAVSLGALGHGSFPLGVARRVLDELEALGARKLRSPGITLSKQTTFQRDFAEATAAVRAAGAYVRESFSRLYDAAQRDAVTLELRGDCRLATSHVVQVAYRVAHMAYIAAGSDALRNGSVLQRYFRDMHAASQHAMTAEQSFVDAGALFLHVPDVVINL